MDLNGNGLLVEQDKLYLAMDVKSTDFDMDKFRYMCILSGCDYLPSLRGIGLIKAKKFIQSMSSNSDIYKVSIYDIIVQYNTYIERKKVNIIFTGSY